MFLRGAHSVVDEQQEVGCKKSRRKGIPGRGNGKCKGPGSGKTCALPRPMQCRH